MIFCSINPLLLLIIMTFNIQNPPENCESSPIFCSMQPTLRPGYLQIIYMEYDNNHKVFISMTNGQNLIYLLTGKTDKRYVLMWRVTYICNPIILDFAMLRLHSSVSTSKFGINLVVDCVYD